MCVDLGGFTLSEKGVHEKGGSQGVNPPGYGPEHAVYSGPSVRPDCLSPRRKSRFFFHA